MKKQVFLLSSRSEDQMFAKGVAAGMEADLVDSVDATEALSSAWGNPASLVLADVSSDQQFSELEAAVKSLKPSGFGTAPSSILHAICPNDVTTWSRLSEKTYFGHLVLRMFEDPEREGAQYGRMLARSSKGKKTGLSGLLDADAEISVAVLKNSGDRKPLLERAEEFLSSKTEFPPRVASVVLNAVDELLMNAIFDAPTDEFGEQKLSKTSRNSRLSLPRGREVEVQFGMDSEYVGFTTTDRFGSLVKEKLFSCILRDTETKSYEIDSTRANAGLGLSLVFRNGGSLFFVTKPGERTDVTVLFKRNSTTYRAFKEQFRYVAVQTVAT